MHTLTHSYRQQVTLRFNALQGIIVHAMRIAIVLLFLAAPACCFSQQGEDSVIIKGGEVTPFSRHDTVPAAKKDTVKPVKKAMASTATDTTKRSNVKTPRGATIRSAIIPGWGQIYNKKYWKLPLVYGALGITGYVFFDNIAFYNKIKFAYKIALEKDASRYGEVAPELRPLVEAGDVSSLKSNRNTFRQNIDYSVLFFIFFWGLNVLDATVDANLKGFNVTDDLSLKIKPAVNYSSLGVGLVLDIHKGKGKKKLFLAAN